MSKYCKPYGLYVTYIDCMDCEGKECKQKKVNTIQTKLKVDQDVYYVLGDKKNKCVVSAKVNTIMIGMSGITYLLSTGTIVTPKADKGKEVASCHIKEENVDTGFVGFVQCYATFTTKEKCKEYLRNG